MHAWERDAEKHTEMKQKIWSSLLQLHNQRHTRLSEQNVLKTSALWGKTNFFRPKNC